MRKPYSQDIVDLVVRDYRDKLSSRKIAKKYGMSFSTVLNMVRARGDNIRDASESKRVYSIDDTYFEAINSHSKAQILGFIYADGCLNKKTEHSGAIQVVINSKDADYLEWIRSEMKSERPLSFTSYTANDKRTRQAAWFVTCHQKLVRDIEKLGVTERKSLTIPFPNASQVSQDFLWSFILGVFEGDGCIYLGRCRNGPTLKAAITIAGSLPFNLGLKTFLKEFLIDSDIRNSPTKNGGIISVLTINKVADIMRFYDLAYANATFWMKRKREKFSEYRSKYLEIPATDGGKPSYELIERKAFDDGMMAHLKKLARANGMKTAREIYVKDPNGQIFHANAVKSLCKELNLQPANLFRMIKGKQLQYKGWTIPTPEEIAVTQAAGTIIEKFY